MLFKQQENENNSREQRVSDGSIVLEVSQSAFSLCILLLPDLQHIGDLIGGVADHGIATLLQHDGANNNKQSCGEWRWSRPSHRSNSLLLQVGRMIVICWSVSNLHRDRSGGGTLNTTEQNNNSKQARVSEGEGGATRRPQRENAVKH